jgi:catechol 2,3-dioxygenase-like lactoylglutathione lyase family enzyme
MSVSLSTVHIYVDDPDAALGFYHDTLGLTVQNELENEGFRWITLVTDSQPEIRIVLSSPYVGRSHEDGDALAASPRQGRRRLCRRHRIAPARDWQRCRTLHRPERVRVGVGMKWAYNCKLDALEERLGG